MQVRVFRNLTRGCYSVQAHVNGAWRTVAYASGVVLDSVQFRVSEAGRQRVLRTGKKTVHAFVYGELRQYRGTPRQRFEDVAPRAGWYPLPISFNWIRVSYNPRKQANFYLDTGAHGRGMPIESAQRCALLEDGLQVWCD